MQEIWLNRLSAGTARERNRQQNRELRRVLESIVPGADTDVNCQT